MLQKFQSMAHHSHHLRNCVWLHRQGQNSGGAQASAAHHWPGESGVLFVLSSLIAVDVPRRNVCKKQLVAAWLLNCHGLVICASPVVLHALMSWTYSWHGMVFIYCSYLYYLKVQALGQSLAHMQQLMLGNETGCCSLAGVYWLTAPHVEVYVLLFNTRVFYYMFGVSAFSQSLTCITPRDSDVQCVNSLISTSIIGSVFCEQFQPQPGFASPWLAIAIETKWWIWWCIYIYGSCGDQEIAWCVRSITKLCLKHSRGRCLEFLLKSLVTW